MRISKIDSGKELMTLALPLQGVSVPCGFPSPADDHLKDSLDLNSHVITHPAATYFAKAEGDSLCDMGIHPGDLLVVNRALQARHGNVVIAAIDGQLLCKILDLHLRALVSANRNYAPIPLGDDMDLVIEGVVSHAIHYLRS